MSATIKYWTEEPITWDVLTDAANSGTMDKMIHVRDEITFTDKSGVECTVVAAKVWPTGAFFDLKEMTEEEPMMQRLERKSLCWRDTYMRQALNTKYLDNLPDDLVAAITPRKITQQIAGEAVVTEDKLWLFSYTEKFGRDGRYVDADSPDEEQLPLFQTEADRVKNLNGETWWHWLRSPLASSSTYFANVYYLGDANSSIATGASGVAFGFLIGSEI